MACKVKNVQSTQAKHVLRELIDDYEDKDICGICAAHDILNVLLDVIETRLVVDKMAVLLQAVQEHSDGSVGVVGLPEDTVSEVMKKIEEEILENEAETRKKMN